MIRAIYLVFFKGYSVMRFNDEEEEYGCCSSSLGYNYGHNGFWGVGETPKEAVLNCYKQTKLLNNKK